MTAITSVFDINCPHCGRTVPASTAVCDCGYRFATEDIDPAVAQAREGLIGRGFGPRALAYLIDYGLMTLLSFPIGMFAGLVIVVLRLLLGQAPEFELREATLLPIIVGTVISLSYFVLFEGLYGSTPAKLLLRMRVVAVDGSPCGLKAALQRGVWRIVEGFVLGLPALHSMREPLQQRYGDKSAHTVVADLRQATDLSARSPWRFVAAAAIYVLVATWILTAYTALMAV